MITIDDWRARCLGLNAKVDRLRAENAELRKRLDAAQPARAAAVAWVDGQEGNQDMEDKANGKS